MAIEKYYTDIEFLNYLNDIVSENPNASQRDIGEKCGLSVSVVNGFLKRCLSRGWIATKNLNMSKLQYMLTVEGLAELTKRSFRFMKRNFEELNNYKKNIDAHIERAVKEGKQKVVLYGGSKIDFLLRESCLAHGMEFEVRDMTAVPNRNAVLDDELVVIGEDGLDSDSVNVGAQTVYALAR